MKAKYDLRVDDLGGISLWYKLARQHYGNSSNKLERGLGISGKDDTNNRTILNLGIPPAFWCDVFLRKKEGSVDNSWYIELLDI